LNVVWPPAKGSGFARTFGELAVQSEKMWDDYVDIIGKDKKFSRSCWRLYASQARAHLKELAKENAPLHFICETQTLLRPYLEGRKKTHLLYKIIRADSDGALHSDFDSGDTVEQQHVGKHYDAIQEEALERLKSAEHVGKEPMNQNESLIRASEEGHELVVAKLLAAGVGANEIFHKDLALTKAALQGHIEVAKVLLSAGADPNLERFDGWTPLLLASQTGNTAITSLLLAAGADTEKTKDADCTAGSTAIILAIRAGNLDEAQMLLRYGADVKKVDKHGHSSLHWACQGGFTDILELLISHDATVDEPDRQGRSGLHLASKYGHVDVVEILLDNGADKNKQDSRGETPLCLAESNGQVGVVTFLKAKGATTSDRRHAALASCTGAHFDLFK
jgi:ankyrin repeat protein